MDCRKRMSFRGSKATVGISIKIRYRLALFMCSVVFLINEIATSAHKRPPRNDSVFVGMRIFPSEYTFVFNYQFPIFDSRVSDQNGRNKNRQPLLIPWALHRRWGRETPAYVWDWWETASRSGFQSPGAAHPARTVTSITRNFPKVHKNFSGDSAGKFGRRS